MRIGVPTFMTRVSPRFDCARTFLLLTLRDGKIESREELAADGWTPRERVSRLVDLGVDEIICGGIDAWSAESFRSAGVTLYGGVAGEIEDALTALVKGQLKTATDRAEARSPQSSSEED